MSLLKIQLRDHQKKALRAFNKSLKQGKNKMALVMATASGKTIASMGCIESYFKQNKNNKQIKVLFVSHLAQIWRQTLLEFEMYLPGLSSVIYAGSERNKNADITVASVKTLNNDINNNRLPFKKNSFDFIIIDEFHHSGADTFITVLEYFKPKVLLGMSCLKERGDNKQFLHYFGENIVYELDTVSAIEIKAIAGLKYYGVFDSIDYNAIYGGKKHYTEFDQNRSLIVKNKTSKIINKYFVCQPNKKIAKKVTSLIIDKFSEVAENKKAIAFCTSIRHAIQVTKSFNDRGISAVAIHSPVLGKKDCLDRDMQQKTEDFKAGKYQVACTIDKWLEGANFPDVEVGVFMRPTKSWRVFIQSRGRVLRQYPGKKFGIIIDCVGVYKNIKIYRKIKEEEVAWLSTKLGKSLDIQYVETLSNKELIEKIDELKLDYGWKYSNSISTGRPDGSKTKKELVFDPGTFEINTKEIDIFYRTGELEHTKESLLKAFFALKKELGRVPASKEFFQAYGVRSNRLAQSFINSVQLPKKIAKELTNG